MNEIVFKRTSNVFLNTGIVALHHYLERYKFPDAETQLSDEELWYELNKDQLLVRSNRLLEILEQVYYLMGREVYDTANKKALQENSNAYYISSENRFVRFPAMNTYGLAALITNNAAGKTIKFENTKRRKYLLKQGETELVQKFVDYFEQNSMKLLEQLYFEEPYVKITRIDIDKKYFEEGNDICYLTGERFKKLVDTTNISPFFAGLLNFASFLKDSDKKISWKAMYLSRFSPKFCFYMYIAGLKSLVCYLIDSNSLVSLKSFYQNYKSIFRSDFEMLENNFMANFKLHSFKQVAKDTDKRDEGSKDYSEQFEILFMLIYTIYYQILYNKGISKPEEIAPDDIFAALSTQKESFNLVSFKADEFAATLRPNSFENFNQFKFTIRLIIHLEKNGIVFSQILSSLKFIKTSDRNSKNSYRLERQVRNSILEKILKQKSILTDIENLFYNCFTYLNSGDAIGFKNFKMLLDLVNLYEPIMYQPMEKEELQRLQERAIKLGSSIGISISNYDEGDKSANAKKARTYIIGLHKARNAEQFREAIIRLQTKYGIVVSNELLEGLNEETYEFIKQFAVISALNILNSILQPKSDKKDENK
jgi:tmRNA-binding protein